MRRYVRGPLSVRFWAKVDRRGPDECWPWLGAIGTAGYGKIGIAGRETRDAHRVAYELTFGPIPASKLVRHACDVRECVNPRHLLLGTKRDNYADSIARGRAASGERHPGSKLTSAAVAAIRGRATRGESVRSLARDYGVSWLTVRNILRGVSWKESVHAS